VQTFAFGRFIEFFVDFFEQFYGIGLFIYGCGHEFLHRFFQVGLNLQIMQVFGMGFT